MFKYSSWNTATVFLMPSVELINFGAVNEDEQLSRYARKQR